MILVHHSAPATSMDSQGGIKPTSQQATDEATQDAQEYQRRFEEQVRAVTMQCSSYFFLMA
jgi:hypothetical protein